MSLFEIDAIDAYYDESYIIRDLSVSVEEGETCAFLGRNGAGKTTTLRYITGMTPPEVREGTTRFKDNDITGIPARDMSVWGISLVSEEWRVFPNPFVAENLHLAEVVNNKLNAFGRSLSLSHREMLTEEIYDQFSQLDKQRNQRAGTFSGGEQQMLVIARALRQNTDLLFLDEPYEGLAPKTIKDVEDMVEHTSDAGVTILLVEQNAAVAIKLVDRVYVIDQEGIIFNGTAEELRNDDETRERCPGV